MTHTEPIELKLGEGGGWQPRQSRWSGTAWSRWLAEKDSVIKPGGGHFVTNKIHCAMRGSAES